MIIEQYSPVGRYSFDDVEASQYIFGEQPQKGISFKPFLAFIVCVGDPFNLQLYRDAYPANRGRSAFLLGHYSGKCTILSLNTNTQRDGEREHRKLKCS